MFDSNKTWFCKQLRTEDAKQISEQLNIKDGETTEDGLLITQKPQNFFKKSKNI